MFNGPRKLNMGETKVYDAFPADCYHAAERRRITTAEYLVFERLITDLSARFVNVPPEQVDLEIEDALKQVLVFFQVDRCGLLGLSPDRKRLHVTHAAYDEGIEHVPVDVDLSRLFPWSHERLVIQKEYVSVSKLSELPPEAEKDCQSWSAMGVQSSLVIPLFFEGSISSLIVIGSLRRQISWPEECVPRLRMLGEIFINALERRNADRVLRESEARLSMTIEAVGAGLWIMDVDSCKVWVSPESRVLFHFGPDEEIYYESYFRMIHPGDRERVHQNVQQALRSGESLNCDYRIVLPDGSIRWIGSRGRCFMKSNGAPRRIMGLSFDITERKQTEAAQIESMERHQAVVEAFDGFIYICSPDYRVEFMNQRLIERTGRNAVGEMCYKVLHERDSICEWCVNERVFQGETVRWELQSPKDHRWYYVANTPVRHADGTISKQSMIMDITERKLAEAALEESRAQIAAVMNSTKDFIWSVDPERFGLLMWNRAFGDYFSERRGIKLEVGMTPAELVPPDYVTLWHDLFSRALREGFLVAEYVVVAQTNTLHLSLHVMRRGSDVFGISVFGRDITELKRAEQELRQSEERFRQVAESVGDFIWEIDANGLYRYTSPAVEKILGYTPDELIGKMQFYDLFVPEVREELKASAFQAFAAKKSFRSFPNANMSKDGKIVHLETSGVPVLDDAGNLIGYRGADTDVTHRRLSDEALRKAYEEIARLNNQLAAENIYLRAEMDRVQGCENIIGQSDAMRYVFFRVQQVAATDATVLITGETGTGKGLVARAIYDAGKRRNQPMITVNCAALPANLIESELFGREKGAFTGAHAAQIGRFELANKGTIFLDEIGELPLELQAKLLRVVESGEFERLGGPRTIKVDVRIIASTNRDLKKEIQEGRFREDLFYRVNVFPITMPPLRQRRDDIPLLVRHFVEKHSRKIGNNITEIPQNVMKALKEFPWPGNVRELENVIERSVISTNGHVLRLAEAVSTASTASEQNSGEDLSGVERGHILKVLKETFWKIEGPNGAARILGLKPSTLRSRMKKLDIHKPGEL